MNFFIVNLIDILIAVFIDWIVGDPYWFPHPVIYIGKLISALDKKGRSAFKKGKKLKCFGGFIVLTVALVSFLIPFIILIIFKEKDRKSTRLNSSHANISYAVFCLKKKKKL